MKIKADYTLDNKYLPKDYRRGFISLIKKAFENADDTFYHRLYDNHTLKPFTFSIYFPELEGEENGQFKVGTKVSLFFKTNAPEYATYFYNGIINEELKTHPLFDNEMNFEGANALFGRNVKADEAIFKTIAPILINNKGDSHWYLMPGEEGFKEGVQFIADEMAKAFLNIPETDITFEPLQYDDKKVLHYNQFMRGYHGTFKIKAPPRFLDLVYNVGFGARRSQGFGMIELAK